MKRSYIGLIALLVVALVAIWAFSRNDEAASMLGLNTATFDKTLFAAATSSEQAQVPQPKGRATGDGKRSVPAPRGKKGATAATTSSAGTGNNEHYVRPANVAMDTTKKNILFIGDSMLEGLKPRLAAYAEANGHKMNAVIWYSSTTEIWGRNGAVKVREYVKKFKPDYIFISLGGNELFVSNIQEKRQQYVDAILREFGNIPYVWIGPPNWKPDTGINKMLSASCRDGSFYLSYTPDQHYDRARDGAHPTRTSAQAWMDRVCTWVVNKSSHPIRLNRPSKTTASCHTEILQPAK